MESEDGMANGNLSEEVLHLPGPSTAGSEEDEGKREGEGEEEEVEEGDEDGDRGEENEGEGEDEMQEGEGVSTVTGEGLLELVDSTTSDVQVYQQLERFEYEALAEKKRKSVELTNQEQGLAKKPRQIIGVTREEIAEVMSYTDPRRRKKANKKKGRRKGSRNSLSPEITKKLGDANLHYAHGEYEDAIRLMREVVWMAPSLPDPYHTLGLVYNSKGDKKKATDCYMIAAFLGPKDTSLWKPLVAWSIDQGNTGQAWYCLSKAISADPADVTLRYRRASLYLENKDFLKAAESYEEIARMCRDNVEALKKATMLYNQCGQSEKSASMLEDYLKDHPTDADHTIVELLASLYMERSDYAKALQHIEHAERVCSSRVFPLCLTIKKGICHLHLADMDKAEVCFRLLGAGKSEHHVDLTIVVGNAFMELQQYESALKYYLMLEGCASFDALVSLKIANCYSALKEATSAIQFFYKALGAHEDDIDVRLTLASLLFEEKREDEAINLLSPPPDPGSPEDGDSDNSEQWWHNVKVKLKLSQLYNRRGMHEAFVEVIYPLVHDSLKVDSIHQKVKHKKKLSRSELLERVKILGDHQTDSVFGQFRRLASKSDVLKANRAKRRLLESTSGAMEGGLEWESDGSEDENQQPPLKAPWPDFFKDEENYTLLSDLCGALTSLRRYSEALELITLSLKTTYKTLSTEKREKFRALGAEIAMNITDPSDGFDYVRYLVQQRPHSKAAWNCYYKLVVRLENRLSKHNKFLHHMRAEHKDLVAPMIISGNQFTLISQHQVAARDYLEAYKQMPDSPLVNLCAGTALVNLALGLRLQNKHQCVAQGLAFLYNNLRLCENSQESLYNLARACHHVGLVSLAASYYEKVLAIHQEDLPLPEIVKTDKDPTEAPKPGYCDLRREAAFNLHLIYKNSGALDLARQVLKNYCTL